MKESKVILCTGGIGSGKSHVVRAFSAMGIPSYDCDSAAKRLYDTDPDLIERIAEIAGKDVMSGGKIDRAALAARIFSDAELLSRIEGVVHPAVIRDFENWRNASGSDVVLVESAIMLQKPIFNGLPDFVLMVTCPVEERIERVSARDGLSRQKVLERMEAQEEHPEMADFIIETNDRQAIVPAVIEIIQKLKNGKDRS